MRVGYLKGEVRITEPPSHRDVAGAMTEIVRRKIDRSDQIARAALADALTHFPKWRDDLALLAIRADRVSGAQDVERIVLRCEEIARELSDVRAGLILELADAPARICGHSRVVDIEKALDNIENALRNVTARLENAGVSPRSA